MNQRIDYRQKTFLATYVSKPSRLYGCIGLASHVEGDYWRFESQGCAVEVYRTEIDVLPPVRSVRR